ncbi:hypothetical protein UlMin_006874 [Ulmus minor]
MSSLFLPIISTSSFCSFPQTKTPNTTIKNKKAFIVKASQSNQNSPNPQSHYSLPRLDRRSLILIGVASMATGSESIGAQSAEIKLTPANEFPITLDKVVSTVVARPKKSRSKKEKDDEEEVLVIGGIQFDRNVAVKFDVYVNDEDQESPSGADKAEFAGSLVNVPHSQGRGKAKEMTTTLRLGLTDLLEDVGAEDDESVVVTLVPKEGVGQVTVGRIGIEFLA